MRPTTHAPARPRASTAQPAVAGLVSAAVPALMGLALLALIGFVPYPAVHDAFHDVRHTAGFPCH